MKLFSKDISSTKKNTFVLQNTLNIELTFNDNSTISIDPKHVMVSKNFIVKDTVIKGTLKSIINHSTYKALEINTCFGAILSHVKLRDFKKMELKPEDEVYVGFDNIHVHVLDTET